MLRGRSQLHYTHDDEGKAVTVDATWTWTDLAPARAGGRPLPNHIRLFLLTAAMGGGVIFGELVRLIAA
jgi:hypothetical protein